MKRSITFTMILIMFLAACGPNFSDRGITTPGESTPIEITAVVSTVVAETIGPSVTQGPFPTAVPATPIPTLPSSSLSPTELKYRVLERFPDFFFCDPDFYPIAHDDEMTLARQRFQELQANQEEFQAILSHNRLSGTNTFTGDQELLIYRDHKKLNAIHFDVVGDKYQFQIQTGSESQQGSVVTGTVDSKGSIEIQKQESSFPTCPICLAAGTQIDTPRGTIRVENLRVGDQIWTMNEAGERVVGEILRTSRVPVPSTHQVVHVVLSDGRELWASPGHPTSDERALDDLRVGDLLDGARVTRLERLPYEGMETYDLLPSGDTGFYWANRILMGSTLTKP